MNNVLEYAICEGDARSRYESWSRTDPFPEIQPALLNSADIADYVCATAMIWPFYAKQLKSASYEMNIGNEILYWDAFGKEVHSNIRDNDTITFYKNSITYVTLKENFLLPDYIALRFNLTINHVHKGLLLGTGPLVNPGYRGKLLIPIHNLTPNDYPVRPGDPLISVEFTKLSPILDWVRNIGEGSRPDRFGKYNEKRVDGLQFKDYLKKALPHGINKVESSLSSALTKANIEIKKVRRTSQIWSTTVSLVTIVGIAGLVWMTWQMLQSYQSDKNEKIFAMYSAIAKEKNSIELLELELRKIRYNFPAKMNEKEFLQRTSTIENELSKIKDNINMLEHQVYSGK